jgi:hypothetical protein
MRLCRLGLVVLAILAGEGEVHARSWQDAVST